jgi:hypothetical protein
MLLDLIEDLVRGKLTCISTASNGEFKANGVSPAALLPGSFNPLHEGHLRLAEVGAAFVGASADFELSVTNVDKPDLSTSEVRRRAQQFLGKGRLWITRAPTFAEKAKLFPRTTFVIGSDTAERLVARRYYDHDEARMDAAFEQIRSHGCRFLVAGRKNQAGVFVSLEDLALPANLRNLFTSMPKPLFDMPHSSSELRQNQGQPDSIATRRPRR